MNETTTHEGTHKTQVQEQTAQAKQFEQANHVFSIAYAALLVICVVQLIGVRIWGFRFIGCPKWDSR